jgi:adenosylcobinamide kinase/adenosylcobinamide-phosphate guanylyltransferase
MTVGSVLVLGGARSGKSHYAEEIAQKSNFRKVYVATAQAFDEEMEDRIAGHRARRDGSWTVLEAPLDVAAALRQGAGTDTALVVDCLTLWLTNRMLGQGDHDQACDELTELVPDLPGLTIFVSNEVGSGIVPDNELGRRFRDAQGRLNQMMAAACDTVVLCVAGLPMILKGEQP